MSKKVLAFAGSSSKKSINKKFASYAAHQLSGVAVEVLDLNDYEMPIFSVDKEAESGYPDLAVKFRAKINEADAIVISFAEHNGSYSAAFKNIFDWISRMEKKVWGDKPMLLLATSPGGRGAQIVLETATNKFKRMNPNTILSFSLPSFNENFDDVKGILDEGLRKDFEDLIKSFQEAV